MSLVGVVTKNIINTRQKKENIGIKTNHKKYIYYRTITHSEIS